MFPREFFPDDQFPFHFWPGESEPVVVPPPAAPTPERIFSWGVGRYLAQVLGPDKYWESEFWNRFQNSLGFEVEGLLRWVQIWPNSVTDRVIAGTYPPTDIEGILAQWFPQTVSGQRIALWESFLSIASDTAQPDSVRRSQIINQLANIGQSPTVQYMLNIVKQYVDDAIIIDQNALATGTHDNSFIIRVIKPYGVPANDVLMRNAVDTFKPATLAYTIQYTETDFTGLADRDFVALGNTDFATMNY